jgi:hypothetical protein
MEGFAVFVAARRTPLDLGAAEIRSLTASMVSGREGS